MRIQRRSIVTVFVRHSGSCPNEGQEFYRGCQCPKWLRYSHAGKQHRIAASTRTWGIAEEKAQELQKRLDAGDAPLEPSRITLVEATGTFITAKESEGVSAARVKVNRRRVTAFSDYMTARGKTLPEQITDADVIAFRASWTLKSSLTRQKVQSTVRSFLKFIKREDLHSVLKTIKKSRADEERLEPKPFTEVELHRLIAQVPISFPDVTKAARLTALIHLMVSTGLAIRDAVGLEKASIAGGWLRIKRQKTGAKVTQKLDAKLVQELHTITNGNPRYVFWSGAGAPDYMTTIPLADLKTLMIASGVYIPGNLSHRFRDTACDFWLAQGCSMTDVAALLGDSVAVVEEHYASLASKRMEARLATLPVRTW